MAELGHGRARGLGRSATPPGTGSIPAIPADLGTDAAATPVWWAVVALAASALILVLSWRPLRNLFARRQLMNASFNRWQLANAYGAFGTVTKERIEIVVEGTLDEQPDAATRGASTGSRASPATCAASRGSARRTTCASTG